MAPCAYRYVGVEKRGGLGQRAGEGDELSAAGCAKIGNTSTPPFGGKMANRRRRRRRWAVSCELWLKIRKTKRKRPLFSGKACKPRRVYTPLRTVEAIVAGNTRESARLGDSCSFHTMDTSLGGYATLSAFSRKEAWKLVSEGVL